MRVIARSRQVAVGLALCTALLLTQGLPAGSPGSANLTVHEWGTFLSVQGSDGETLGGMVDSEEVLPAFVDMRGVPTWERSMILMKMETPVTYFYTDRPRDIRVQVNMPKGLLSHWYPSVRTYGPSLTAKTTKPAESFLEWRKITVIPQAVAQRGQEPPAVAKESTWRFARETDSALVKIHTWHRVNGNAEIKETDQYEKFLFYRGLGTFTFPLRVRSSDGSGGATTLLLENHGNLPLRNLFAVQVEGNGIRFAALGDLSANGQRDVHSQLAFSAARPLADGVPEVKSAVAQALTASGLYPKEAQAMVNTWERSYFHTDGLRILYVLPRESVDETIPIRIEPKPMELVRVMVGRVEVLTPARERQIAGFVAQLGPDAIPTREAASNGLARLGRLSEPALRRVLATAGDPEVRARAQTLIDRVGSGAK